MALLWLRPSVLRVHGRRLFGVPVRRRRLVYAAVVQVLMRYFIDTEFIERGPDYPLQLVSICVVRADGREFYAQNIAAHPDSDFVAQHVWPHLRNLDFWRTREGESKPWRHTDDIAQGLIDFVGDDTEPEFWGYYSAYDWVVTCQLFGDMGDLPKGWPYFCRDLRQALDERGLHDVKQADDAVHTAWTDAWWVAETWHSYIGSKTS